MPATHGSPGGKFPPFDFDSTRPVQDSLALTLLAQIVIAWLAVSLLVALAFGVMAARLSDRRRFRDRRRGPFDRRTGPPDRRIGLPDPRDHPVERRVRVADRRAGPPDRRRTSRRDVVAIGS